MWANSSPSSPPLAFLVLCPTTLLYHWHDDLHEFIQNKRLIKRAGTPDDLIGAAMFLASPASSFISGQTLAVCGGEVMI